MRRVGELRVVIEPGVEVREIRVSGNIVPLEDFPIVLEPGEVDVEVYGPEPDDRDFKLVLLRAGKLSSVVVGPFNQPPPPNPTPGELEPRDSEPTAAELERLKRRQRGLKTAFWAGLGFTIASGAALAALGTLTAQRKRDFEDAQDDTQDGMGPPESVADEFYGLRRATNAMVAVTAVVGMTTVVLGLFAFSRSPTPTSRASVRRRFHLNAGGFQMRF
jgi:hypothetical protein